jgi:hypothetical protein
MPCARRGQLLFSETDIIGMLEFLIENIFVIFGERIRQQTVERPMGTICDRYGIFVSLMTTDMFHLSYEYPYLSGL